MSAACGHACGTLQPMQLIEPHACDHLSSVWRVRACAAWLIALMNPVSLRRVRSLTVSTLPLLLAALGQALRGGITWWNIFNNRDGWRPWLAALDDSAQALSEARLSRAQRLPGPSEAAQFHFASTALDMPQVPTAARVVPRPFSALSYRYELWLGAFAIYSSHSIEIWPAQAVSRPP